jgi:hypothetical protein
MLPTVQMFRLEHRHHIQSAISIPVVDDEFGAAEDTDQTGEPNAEPSFLEHLTDGGVGGDFSRLYRTTWQEPHAAFRMTHQQHASLRIA